MVGTLRRALQAPGKLKTALSTASSAYQAFDALTLAGHKLKGASAEIKAEAALVYAGASQLSQGHRLHTYMHSKLKKTSQVQTSSMSSMACIGSVEPPQPSSLLPVARPAARVRRAVIQSS
jgi:hypothetical protein